MTTHIPGTLGGNYFFLIIKMLVMNLYVRFLTQKKKR